MTQVDDSNNLAKVTLLLQEKKWDEAKQKLGQELERDLTPSERAEILIQMATAEALLENSILEDQIAQTEETLETLQTIQGQGGKIRDVLAVDQARDILK